MANKKYPELYDRIKQYMTLVADDTLETKESTSYSMKFSESIVLHAPVSSISVVPSSSAWPSSR